MAIVAPLLAKFPWALRGKILGHRSPAAGFALRSSALCHRSGFYGKRMVGLDGFIFFSVVAGGWFGVSSSGAQTNTHTPFQSEWVKLSCQCQTVVRHLNPIFHRALKPLSNRRRGGGVADKGNVEYNDNILDTKWG